MPERTVLFDTVAYFVDDDSAPNKRQRLTAKRGDRIELSASEAKRLEGLGAIGSDEQLAAQAVSAAAPVTTPTSPGALRTMTVDDLARYMARASEDDQEQVSGWMEELLAEHQAADEAAATTASTTPEAPAETDLAEMNSNELIAYLSQNPDRIDDVEAANNARSTPYVSVETTIAKTREELAARA